MNKRGVYYFVIDAFLGGAIVLVSLIVILNSYTAGVEKEQPLTILEDFIAYIQNTQVRDFQGDFTQESIADGNITKLDNTLFEQVADFHYRNNLTNARLFLQELVDASIPSHVSIRYFYSGDLIYYKTEFPLDEAKFVLSSKKVAVAIINNSVIYGPHMVEVMVWSS